MDYTRKVETIEIIRMYGKQLSNALPGMDPPESIINKAKRIIELAELLIPQKPDLPR